MSLYIRHMLQITETNILLAVIGSIGVIASLVVLLYGNEKTTKYEKQLKQLSRTTTGVASEDFSEVHTD